MCNHRNPTWDAGNPAPAVLHQTLTTTQNGQLHREGRCVFIGDIHGCVSELKSLLNQIEFKRGVDNLLLVGDLVGKGPHPREVRMLNGFSNPSLQLGSCAYCRFGGHWVYQKGRGSGIQGHASIHHLLSGASQPLNSQD